MGIIIFPYVHFCSDIPGLNISRCTELQNFNTDLKILVGHIGCLRYPGLEFGSQITVLKTFQISSYVYNDEIPFSLINF